MTIEIHGHTVWHVLTDRKPDSDFSLGQVELVLGGPAATVARQLRLLGREVRLHTSLGEDELGTLARRQLEAAEIAISPYQTTGRSPRVLAHLDATGDARLIADVAGAADPDGTGVAPARSGALTYVTGFPGLYPIVDALSSHGARLVVDTGFKPFLDDETAFRAHLRRMRAALGVVVISGARMSETTRRTHAELALGLGAEIVLITRGSAGVEVIDRDGEVDLPPTSVPVVDTMCAGDVFVAGYLAGRDLGLSQLAAARAGQLVAEAKVQILGGLPSASDLPDDLLREAN